MKRILLLTLLICGLYAKATAQMFIPSQWERVYFTISYVAPIINPTDPGNSHPKSPVHPPVVYLDAHTLYICSEHSGYTLTITDTDETEVFSTYVPENTYSVVLPSTLSGEYTIELSNDTFVFAGEIEL